VSLKPVATLFRTEFLDRTGLWDLRFIMLPVKRKDLKP